MNEKQALDVIKAALDVAQSKGVFQNLEAAFTVIQAYNVVSEKLKQSEDANSDGSQP